MQGPHNAGSYNSRFWETDFFRDCGSWDSEYGEFFLSWYSNLLIHHADVMLQAAAGVLKSHNEEFCLVTISQVRLFFNETFAQPDLPKSMGAYQ